MKPNAHSATSFYSLMRNQAGELLLIIDAEDSEPLEPLLLYDGGTTLLLHRNAGSNRALRNLQADAAQSLRGATNVHVVEYEGDERLVRQYDAPMRIVHNVDDLTW